MLLDRLDRSGSFPLLNGNATNWTRQIEMLVAAACAKLDIKCLGTHGFRANAAQRTLDDLLELGVDERSAHKQVSRLLGHRRTSVTRSYTP
jgi:integrase